MWHVLSLRVPSQLVTNYLSIEYDKFNRSYLRSFILCSSVPELPLHLVVRPVEDPTLRAAVPADIAAVILASPVEVVCRMRNGR